MNWSLEYSAKAAKQLRKLDRISSRYVVHWMREHIEGCADPRTWGKPLKGSLREYWRYRVGEYRVVCDIQDDRLVVLAVEVGHRRDVYRKRKAAC